MGWNGLKIDGHTGTQFKHKKGFVKRKRAVEQQLRTQGATGREYRPDTRKRKVYPRWMYIVPTLLVGFALAFFGYQVLSETARAVEAETQQLQADRAYKNSINYDNLIRMAEASWNRGALAYAIEDYERAVRVAPERWEAQWGLLSAYAKSCSDDHTHCEAARSQLRYCAQLLEQGKLDVEYKKKLEEIEMSLQSE